ncbi:DUF4136 domain-containing protein [Rufibacter immobilis]|uniref:DUF4136 domain-containing protein n=1 Tax=Rufibacter immobilis TaxID=1348778 RepID=UPI0035E59179
MWALICLLAISCSPVKVMNYQAAPDFNLSRYRTFGFMDVTAGNSDSANVRVPAEQIAVIQREIANQLERRGLTQSTSNPDLLVNVGVVVLEKNQTRQTNFRTDAPYYTGQRRYSWRSQEVVVGQYKEGTISVHLVDNAQNTLVWSAEAESVVPEKQEKLQERIAEGVAQLFSSLP